MYLASVLKPEKSYYEKSAQSVQVKCLVILYISITINYIDCLLDLQKLTLRKLQ